MDLKETVTVETYIGNRDAYADIIVVHDATGSSNGITLSFDAYNQLRDHFLSEGADPETSDEALPIADVVERKAGRITVSFFRKVYKQFIDEEISMTKMLELMTEQAHRTDVCIKCQRPLDGTNCSKDKCNACFTVNA